MSIATEIQRLQQAKADIKAAIEEKGVNVGDETIDAYAAKIDEISGGGSGEDYLPFVKQIQFNSLNDFGKVKVELNLDSCNTLFEFCKVSDAIYINNTVEHLIINADNISNMASMLQCAYATRDEKLRHITLNFSTKNVASWVTCFAFMQGLEIIDGEPLDFTTATNVNNMFNGCTMLIFVKFAKEALSRSINLSSCGSLNDISRQSIIDGLVDLTGGTARTLTLHATVGSKLTDEQKATITAKNWTLTY